MFFDKMIIRSVTYTIDLSEIESMEYQKFVRSDLTVINERFLSCGYKVRTVRFNVIPANYLVLKNRTSFTEKIDALAEFCKQVGVRWFDIAFDLLGESNDRVDEMCSVSEWILKKHGNSFVNLIAAKEYINAYAVFKSAEVIKNVSNFNENGIDNFRLGVSLNVMPNTPFFPFSYSGRNNSFSIAIETTPVFLGVIKEKFNHDYMMLKKEIVSTIGCELVGIEKISRELGVENDIPYNGLDISLSPFPDEDVSVVSILNLLGIDDFGSNGTQFLTSYLTSILKEVIAVEDITTIGFNGVMYSLLEDKKMCEAHDNGNFKMDSIILYSTVCGCGLDMVPLPGNILTEEIASLILDVATTSIKLNKPLGVRVLPISGKKAGEKTNLKLDFLTNTVIPTVKHIHIDKSIFSINKFYVKY